MPSLTMLRQDAAQNGEVVRFCPAARKEYLLPLGADELGYPLARFFNRITGPQTVSMEAGGIAKDIGEKGPHGLPNGGMQWRSRIMIEIDNRFTHAMPRSPQVPPLTPRPPAMRRGV
jgi:hypothetical protein